jgi:hypothetical protein
MKHIISVAATALALSLAAIAPANPATELTHLQTKLDRLSHYFNTQCDEGNLTQKCNRVQNSIIRIDREIAKVRSSVSLSLRSSATVSTQNGEPTVLDRQFAILQVRLDKVEGFIARLETSTDANKDAKIQALETQLELLRSRLVVLDGQRAQISQ